MDRINYRLRTKTGGENWFIGPDRLDHTKSNIMVRLDDGSDTTLNIKNIVKSQNKGRILYLELTEGNGMTTDEVAERLFEMTEFLGNIKPFYLVVMNKKDESTYICNGMKAEGNDVVLEFEWGDLMDYSEELSEAEQDIGGDKSDIADEVHGIKIWIDDIREAPQGFKWFHTVREFIKYVDEHGTEEIELIDTDHDAGDYQKFGGDYIRCFDYLDFIGAKNITIHIHSANPVGANNIRRIISRNKEENGWREVRNTQSE